MTCVIFNWSYCFVIKTVDYLSMFNVNVLFKCVCVVLKSSLRCTAVIIPTPLFDCLSLRLSERSSALLPISWGQEMIFCSSTSTQPEVKTHTHTHTLSLACALTCTHKQTHTHTHKSYFSILISIDSHFLCFHWCLINCRVINVCRVCCCTDSYLFDLWLTIWSLCCTRLAVAFHILHPSAAALWNRHSILTASYVCYRDWNELFHSPANLAATFLSYRPFIISTSPNNF